MILFSYSSLLWLGLFLQMHISTFHSGCRTSFASCSIDWKTVCLPPSNRSSYLFVYTKNFALKKALRFGVLLIVLVFDKSILKPTVPKPFRFQTEERSILKSSNAERIPKQGKVKDGELIRKQKEIIKTASTLARPFRFRTEERSILRAAKDEHVQELKDVRLEVKHQEKAEEEKLYPRVAKLRDLLDLSVDHSVLTVSGKLRPVEAVQDTLTSLPDEVVDGVGITMLPSKNLVCETRGKFECLEIQAELSKGQNEEQLKKVASLESSLQMCNDDNKELMRLHTASLEGSEWVKERLYLAEMKVAEYAVLH